MNAKLAAIGFWALALSGDAHGRGRLQVRIAPIVVLVLAAIVVAGWFLQQPLLVQLIPGASATVLNTALSLALCGFAILALSEGRRERLAKALAVAVLAIAIVTQLQVPLGVEFGIDWPSLHAWLADYNPNPGRTSLVTSLAIALLAAAILGHRQRRLACALAVSAFVLAVLNLAGYAVGLDELLGSMRFPRMGPVTTACVILLAGAILRLEFLPRADAEQSGDRPDERISLTAAALLAGVAVAVGVGTLSLMQVRLQEAVGSSLQLALKTRSEQFAAAVRIAERNAAFVATRPGIHLAMRDLSQGRDMPAARARLADILSSFVELDFRHVQLTDVFSGEVASIGRASVQPALRVVLASAGKSELLWDGALLLRTRLPLRDRDGELGHAVVLQEIGALGTKFHDASDLGPSGEVGLCAQGDGARLNCFPQRLQPRVYTTAETTVRGEPLPMTRALRGEVGVERTIDYRGKNVHAAFGPVEGLGIGMSIKLDSADVYAPVRAPLIAGVLLLVLLVAGGEALMRAQVAPLASDLAKAEARQRSLIESAPDAILVVDAGGRIAEANAEASRLFGYPQGALLGSDVAMLVPAAAREAHAGNIAKFAQAPVSRPMAESLDLRAARADGTDVPVEISLSPLGTASSGLTVAIVRDISGRRRDEALLRQKNEELRRLNGELEAFSYSVSHDLRAPLRAIEGYSAMLAEDLAGALPEESARRLERVRAQTRHMNRLIEDLLQLARLSTQPLDARRVVLRELVEDCVTPLMAEAIAAERQVAFDVGDLGECEGDPTLLRQAFHNLLANAFKFTRDAKPALIVVSATRDAGWLTISVRDNGAGFDMEYSAKLFRPFQRLHSPREFDGTGLGLTIVQWVAQRHGGTAWGEGEPGRGATFHLRLRESSSTP